MKFTDHEGAVTKAHETAGKQVSEPTTTLVKEIRFHDGRTIAYEYDAEERITKVTDSADGVTEYTYDALGQLLTETKGSQTVSVTYDKYGNIQSKNGIPYSYGSDDANCCGWKDLLTAYNGKAITYDANGNPINYQGTAATWEKGRQLKMFGANSYKYNNDGIRIQKRTATEIHDYILDGTNIIKELVTDTDGCPKYTNEYLYDLDGTVCEIKHNGTAYYFYKNLQGDVIAITNATGAVVARYTYDAWGVPTIKEDTSSCNIATVNPFRYRGYYYDTETKFYYLQSRYYDPTIGRFINADVYSSTDIGIQGSNMFAYCNNNPVMHSDPTGEILIGSIIGGAIGGALLSVVSHITTNPDATVGSTLLALAVGAVTGALGGAAGALGFGELRKIVCSGIVGLIAGVYAGITTDGSGWQKLAVGTSTAVITALGTYAGAHLETDVNGTRFGAAVANYSTTILVGSITEPLSVTSQNAITGKNANKKASATNRNINLRNERYRIWVQRKQGMLLGIL